MPVDPERITRLNTAPEREYVLYWAQMNWRVEANHGLLYAVELANRHKRKILGKMRYMSREGMRRKTDTQAYIDEISKLE